MQSVGLRARCYAAVRPPVRLFLQKKLAEELRMRIYEKKVDLFVFLRKLIIQTPGAMLRFALRGFFFGIKSGPGLGPAQAPFLGPGPWVPWPRACTRVLCMHKRSLVYTQEILLCIHKRFLVHESSSIIINHH